VNLRQTQRNSARINLETINDKLETYLDAVMPSCRNAFEP
jgi:hypothetical protein